MNAKNIQFHHRHTFNTVCGAICEKLDTTTYTINGEPQKTWRKRITAAIVAMTKAILTLFADGFTPM